MCKYLSELHLIEEALIDEVLNKCLLNKGLGNRRENYNTVNVLKRWT